MLAGGMLDDSDSSIQMNVIRFILLTNLVSGECVPWFILKVCSESSRRSFRPYALAC